MTITKVQVIDQITADEHGNITYREATRIMEDGVHLSHSYHRSSLTPGQDLTGVPAEVVVFCTAAWTPENVTGWSENFISMQETERQKQAVALQSLLDAEAAVQAAAP